MKRSLLTVTAAMASLALVVAGCGSSKKSSSSASTSSSSTPAQTTSSSSAGSGGTSSSASGTLKLSADPSGALKFDKSSLSGKAGKVTITMTNPAAVPHGVAITGNGVNKTGAIVNQKGTSTVTATLKPGKYTFYCPVPGHRQAGMQGTLTVQ